MKMHTLLHGAACIRGQRRSLGTGKWNFAQYFLFPNKHNEDHVEIVLMFNEDIVHSMKNIK